MRSFITLLIIAVTLYSCAQKMTPATPTLTAADTKNATVIHTEAAQKTESPQVAEGKNIYTTKCARCHSPKPVDNWTVKEWIPIMDRMSVKAELDAPEKANVTAYVNFYAKS